MMHKRVLRSLVVGLLAVLGLGLGVWAQTATLTVTSYSDAVRFAAQGSVKELRVEILSLAGQKVFDSGAVSGGALDWKMLNMQGQPVASGVYLYSVTVKDEFGNVTKRLGKLAVVRGKAGPIAPPLTLLSGPTVGEVAQHPRLQPLGGPDFGTDMIVGGSLGLGTSTLTAGFRMEIRHDQPFILLNSTAGTPLGALAVNSVTALRLGGSEMPHVQFIVVREGYPFGPGRMVFRFGAGGTRFEYTDGTTITERARITDTGNLGIGTTAPSAKTHISNAANQPALRIDSSAGTNAFEIYNTEGGANLIFRVERATGNVHADGSFTGGGADVAERIDTTEPLEAGDVVEIDSENPGKFRKAREAVSTRVAGVISTAPGVILGNEKQLDGRVDARPILALAGRVPVKVTAKYGAIEIGDLLVSSPIPGYAMKCHDRTKCIGAVIGKALEPFKEGVGVIEAQVMLR